MKKTKFIAGALVLSMGLVGTGYALWNDTLEIKSTVKTGNFNVQFEGLAHSYYYANDERAIPNYDPNTNEYVRMLAETSVGDYGDAAETSNANDSITFSVSNLVPGGIVRFDTQVINTGTVAAALKDLTVTRNTHDAPLAEDLLMDIIAWDNTKGVWVPVLKSEWVSVKDVKGNIEIADDLRQNVLLLNQNPDDQITLAVQFKLDKDATNVTQNQQADVTVEFNFEQHLAPMAPQPR